RINLQRFGDHIHLGFAGKRKLNQTWRTKMAAGHAVGIDCVRVNPDVWNTICTRGFNRARQVHRRNRLPRAVGTTVPKSSNLPRHERSVSFPARLHDDNRSMTRIPSHELFAIGHNHAHRTAGSLRQEVTEGEVHERTLSSKVTAYRRDVNDN